MKQTGIVPKGDNTFFNRSLERALQILNVFTSARTSVTATQLSRILGLPKATVLRLCSTLIQYNYLAQDTESRAYTLGLRLFELGNLVFSRFSLGKTASPHLAGLQSRLGKTVFLSTIDKDELLYIDKKEDLTNPIRFTSSVGDRRPPSWGMSGPLLMAYLPDDEVERLLQRHPLAAYTRKSYTEKWAFKEWLRKIRERGYCVEDGTAFDGISGVSAPIRDHEGNIIAAVSVGFISSSVDARGLKRIIKEVTETAGAISKEIGYTETV